MLAMGAYTPLDGFMGHDDWRGSCLHMKLTSGVFWPIPITLSVNKDFADSLHAEEEVALIDAGTGEILAVMQIHEKYSIDKQLEAEHVYRTADPKHPGVAKVLHQGDANLAGPSWCLAKANILPNTPSFIPAPPSHGPCFLSGAGPMSPPSKPAIPCTAATSTW